jgi:hypothetical protein
MTLKEEYETILNLPGASLLKDHVFEICQFLLQLYEEGRLNTRFREAERPSTTMSPVTCGL